MPVLITSVDKNSIAEKHKIKAGAQLISVNSHEINDVLDYGFYTKECSLELRLIPEAGSQPVTLHIRKSEDEELGLNSSSFLMDAQHRCSNNCIFCFIDQLPEGMRESLYFKDDDERLSFLFGNYITLTNLHDHEIDRIIEMKISPINISVHTTNERLRCEMMGNRFAGEKLKYLYRLADAGVEINCQLVLCPGWNDGDELAATLDTLTKYPSIRSIAAVPVGLTGYREGLCELKTFDKQSAAETIDILERYERVYPSDEWFLLAGRPIPDIDYYGELLQLENGVGMLALLRDEFESAMRLEDEQKSAERSLLVCGEAAYEFIKSLVDTACARFGCECEVIAIRNDYFGGSVNVTGLVTATDIIKQLRGKQMCRRLLFSHNMLRREGDMFLDSITTDELAQTLGTQLRAVSDGADLLDALLGR